MSDLTDLTAKKTLYIYIYIYIRILNDLTVKQREWPHTNTNYILKTQLRGY